MAGLAAGTWGAQPAAGNRRLATRNPRTRAYGGLRRGVQFGGVSRWKLPEAPPQLIRWVPSGLTLLEPMNLGCPLASWPAKRTTCDWPPLCISTTSPGLALASEVGCQPAPRRLLASWSTEALAWPEVIRPAFCRQAETKFAQLTLSGTQLSIGSSLLCLSSPALRPRNCSAMAAALAPSSAAEVPSTAPAPTAVAAPWPTASAPDTLRVSPA